MLGFAWNLNEDPGAVKWAHDHGAKFIAEVSLWNHDRWKTLEDLPDSVKTAYNTNWDGQPLFIQGMVFLNINDPAFQQWLSNFINSQIDIGADGFVFDETGGNSEAVSQGGALDAYSMEGFGEYLARYYSAAELQAKGVTSTANFNYKQFLTDKGFSSKYKQGDIWNITFGPDYLAFQQLKTSDLIIKLAGEARAYAATKGKTLLITANADPIYREPSRAYYDVLDYYTFEHAWIGDRWRTREGFTEFPYGQSATAKTKYTIGNGQKAVILESIGEYGEFQKLGSDAGTTRVLHDFAEVYANLGFYCYFDLDPAFMGMQFTADRARLRPYYAFLRDHPEVFNGLSYKPEVAVIPPPLALLSDTGPVDSAQGAAFILSESNIPYDVIDIDDNLDYKVLIANGYAWPEEQLNKLLDFARSGGTVIAIDSRFAMYDGDYKQVSRPELDALKTDGTHTLGAGKFIFFSDYIGWKYWAMQDTTSFNLIKDAVTDYTEPNNAPEGVQLLPYDGGNHMVIHILNYNYADNEFVKQNDVSIRVRMPEGFTVNDKLLTLLSPDNDTDITVEYTADEGWLKFTVPELYIWSVAVLK